MNNTVGITCDSAENKKKKGKKKEKKKKKTSESFHSQHIQILSLFARVNYKHFDCVAALCMMNDSYFGYFIFIHLRKFNKFRKCCMLLIFCQEDKTFWEMCHS